MIKKLILFILLSLCLAFQASALTPMIMTSGTSADPCAAAWSQLTAPDWTLDADHTTNNTYACVSGGTEAGNVATAICTPGTISLGSGGDAVCSDSGVITFDNDGGHISIEQGEIRATIWITNISASNTIWLQLGDGTYDTVGLQVNSAENLAGFVKNNSGVTTGATAVDLSNGGDSVINAHWVDVYMQWNENNYSGACTAAGVPYAGCTGEGTGNCEITLNARIQDGTPTWIGWSGSTDADNYAGNAGNQPGADEVAIGAVANFHGVEADDIEINNTLPGGWEPAL